MFTYQLNGNINVIFKLSFKSQTSLSLHQSSLATVVTKLHTSSLPALKPK